jgi:hypothetical protein
MLTTLLQYSMILIVSINSASPKRSDWLGNRRLLFQLLKFPLIPLLRREATMLEGIEEYNLDVGAATKVSINSASPKRSDVP